ARDYVWVMARTPSLPDADRDRLLEIVKDLGYDPSRLRLVPQRWGVEPDLSPSDQRPGQDGRSGKEAAAPRAPGPEGST
ncbi:MAG TPA: lipocalin family protein, partial [Anaeromyxobacteraceae bacterium]